MSIIHVQYVLKTFKNPQTFEQWSLLFVIVSSIIYSSAE